MNTTGETDGPALIERLTQKQREALRLHAANIKGKKAAAAMGGISEHTVGGHLSEAARLLGTNREGAAAKLAAFEAANPNERGRFSVGDPDLPAVVVVLPAQEQPVAPEVHWSGLLPLRLRKGVPRDLSPSLRLAWIVALAFVVALGFAQLAIGARLLTDVFARTLR